MPGIPLEICPSVASWRWAARGGTREDDEPAGGDVEVVIAAAVVDAAELDHLEPPPGRAVERSQALQEDHAVRDAVELEVVDLRRAVVEEERGDVAVGKELLEREELPPVTQGALREEPDLGEGVEDDPLRLLALDDAEEALHRLPELDLRGVEERQVLFLREHLFAHELLVDGDVVERPPVRLGDGVELLDALREGEIKTLLTSLGPFEQELEGEGGLAGPRIPLDEEDMILGKAPAQDLIEPSDSGAGNLGFANRHGPFSFSKLRRFTKKQSCPGPGMDQRSQLVEERCRAAGALRFQPKRYPGVPVVVARGGGGGVASWMEAVRSEIHLAILYSGSRFLRFFFLVPTTSLRRRS